MKYVQPEYTPENITELRPNEIFVFGSNTEGRHGKGAAKQAMAFGAVYGRAQGLQGQSYAVITKDLRGQEYPLHLIKANIAKLCFTALVEADKTFLVTKIGCGLGGYSVQEIAELFVFVRFEIPSNVVLPKEFIEVIERKKLSDNQTVDLFNGNSLVILVAGGRDFDDYDRVKADLDKHNPDVIVSGMANGADKLGVRYANEYGVQLREFPAQWEKYGKSAGYKRNQQMLDEGKPNLVLVYWDGISKGAKHMLDMSQRAGVKVQLEAYGELELIEQSTGYAEAEECYLVS